MFPFETLEVWKRSVNFAEEILRFVDSEVGQKDAFSLGEQMRRAALSVSTNIAEGTESEGASVSTFLTKSMVARILPIISMEFCAEA